MIVITALLGMSLIGVGAWKLSNAKEIDGTHGFTISHGDTGWSIQASGHAVMLAAGVGLWGLAFVFNQLLGRPLI